MAHLRIVMLFLLGSALQMSVFSKVILSNTVNSNINDQDLLNMTYVRPYRSTLNGTFLSNDLSFGKHLSNEMEIAHYYVTLDIGDDLNPLRLILDLSLNEKIVIAPDFRIVAFNDGDDEIEEPFDSNCFYIGHVLNHPHSSLAISNCGDGLSGLISFNGSEFTIEPDSSNAQSKSAIKHHVFTRRTRDDQFKPKPSEVTNLANRVRRRAATMRKRPTDTSAYFVETMILVDYSVVKSAGKKLFHRYILMLMAMVNQVFQHPSLKFNVTIVVTEVIKLSKSKSKKLPSNNRMQLLTSVCNYRRRVNPALDSNPRHSDAVIFLTRKPFGSSGNSQIGRMCADSCSIVLDQGIISARTIAHELGHLLSMEHDTGACEGDTYTVMSGIIKPKANRWSSCSNRDLKKFLTTSQSACLKDRPHHRSLQQTAATLPGRGLTRNDQCRLEFGAKYKMYREKYQRDYLNCKQLVCVKEDGIGSILDYALDGMSCGSNVECIKGKCVRRR